MIENYFPQGIASGNAFIGRENEINYLMKNIQMGRHTLLLAPRRYGKTSLAINTFNRLSIPYVEVNCYLALSASAIEKKFLIAVQTLLNKIISKPEKLLNNIQSFLKKGKKSWTLGFKGIAGVEITPDETEDYSENILTSLMLLEHVLEKQQQIAVMFLDEIQEIASLKESRQLEGAIRQFAQHSKKLVFVFSGSNRRMLTQMFDDRTMPLYELCDRIILGRIDAKDYEQYLNNISQKTFNIPLSKSVFQKIIQLSERHPKRIYNLCFCLWRFCEDSNKIPTEEDVIQTWDRYLQQRFKDISYYLKKLSSGQIKVLTLIAINFQQEITGQAAQKKVKLSGPSIVKSLQILEANDYIEKNQDNSYTIIDPLVKDILLNYETVNLD